MKHLLTDTIRHLKHRHKFASTFLFMILLCFLLCVSAYFFLMNTAVKKARENSAHTYQSYINTEASNTNQIIYQLHQSLTQLSYSRSILNMIFYKKYEDSNKNLVESDLALTSQNNLLIESVLMYIPAQDLVITSGYHTATYEQSPSHSLIEAYLNHQVNAVFYENTEKISSLFFYQGKLVMARDFPLNGPKRLATLFYLIDSSKIYYNLTKELSEGQFIWVYDAHDEPIFSHLAAYPPEIGLQHLDALPSSPEHYEIRNHSAFFYSSSDILQWKFIYQVEEAALLPFGNALRIMTIPILILILILLVFSYLFIASGIYLPRQLRLLLNLVNADTSDTDQPSPGQNEFDHLNHALLRMVGQQTELKTTISKVSGDIQARFFQELLSGIQMTEEEAHNALTLAESSFKVHAFYMTGILYCEGELTELESRRHHIQTDFNRLMKDYNDRYGSLSCTLPLDNRTFALILSFDLSDSLLKIIKDISTLEQVIRNLSKNQKIQMQFNLGRIYYHVLDIGFSYQHALEALANHQSRTKPGKEDPVLTKSAATAPGHASAGTSKATPDSHPSPPAEGDDTHRAQQILALVRGDDADNAMILADRIIDGIYHDQPSAARQKECCQEFLSALSKEISHLDYIDFSSLHNELMIFADTGDSDSAQMAERLKHTCHEILTELSKMLKKQQNPYIIESQHYITEHFGDPNLSLNFVAEAIDVNPSYLSKLFAVNLGINFTDYLNQYRIHRSMQMLKETDESIQTIASLSGFNSVQNFIRVFKKFTAITPGQYRKADD